MPGHHQVMRQQTGGRITNLAGKPGPISDIRCTELAAAEPQRQCLGQRDGTIAGDVTLDATGYTDMSGTTPGGALDLTMANLEALMHLQIQAASFTTPVTFSITRIDPIALVPESGLGAKGEKVTATLTPNPAGTFTPARRH